MDAGVPISDPVAGVAMGLIKEGDNFIVLTDILGDEDALGDMDFKIAGTAEGVTAVQMDIKITGLTTEIMRKAMRQAHEARLHILGEMKKAIDGPRAELSKYAPQHAEVFVNPEVIRMIIGPGGKNIKAITAATGASVDIEDSGRISIFAPTAESMEQAKELVQYYDQRPDLGKNYMGKVRKPGTGCISQINDHLFEGRYSPTWIDGKKHARNVYAHTREECEEKLKVLIAEMKAELAELKRQKTDKH